MKKEIFLKPVKASKKIFSDLEKKKLIKLLKPTEKTIKTKTKTGAVSRFYSSSKKFGTHTLMCVGKRSTQIRLSYHEDNEDFMILNPLGIKFKKLYLIISMLNKNDFLKKAKTGTIGTEDFKALELEYDNPALSFFTMLKNTVHCEVTDKTKGQHPVFFVSEPSELKDNKLNFKNFKIILTENK